MRQPRGDLGGRRRGDLRGGTIAAVLAHRRFACNRSFIIAFHSALRIPGKQNTVHRLRCVIPGSA
jgi:hypothetical protein